MDVKGYDPSNPYSIQHSTENLSAAAEEEQEYNTIPQLEKGIAKVKKEMEKAAKNLDFMEAAKLRDRMFELKDRLDEMKK